MFLPRCRSCRWQEGYMRTPVAKASQRIRKEQATSSGQQELVNREEWSTASTGQQWEIGNNSKQWSTAGSGGSVQQTAVKSNQWSTSSSVQQQVSANGRDKSAARSGQEQNSRTWSTASNGHQQLVGNS